MRTAYSLLILGALALAAPLAAQQTEMHLTREEIKTRRQQIVAANLPMTDSVAAKFWPMYRDYQVEVSKLGDRTQTVILDYSKVYRTMSDTAAQRLTDQWLAIQADRVKLHQEWAKKFRKVAPAATVTRFLQIENRLDNIVEGSLQDEIPLVEPK
ncbi:MAG TPA: hypothetical protein VMH88_00075 [Gemmatimonadales bacterium]|nr:hypothetical protein [Gemmatimonadales bacterium]